VKNFVIKKGHFYRGLSKDLYNKIKLMVRKRNYNKLLDTKKTFTISKFWNFKIENAKYVHLKFNISKLQ